MTSRLNLDLEDKKTLDDFKEYVKSLNNGKIKGFLRERILYAFKLDMASSGFKNYQEEINVNPLAKEVAMRARQKSSYGFDIDKRTVLFLIEFFKKYFDKNYEFIEESIPRTELEGFIRSTLNIKQKRAINEWIEFLEDISWISNVNKNRVRISFGKAALFNLLGEDPTGTFSPEKEAAEKRMKEAQKILTQGTGVNPNLHSSVQLDEMGDGLSQPIKQSKER